MKNNIIGISGKIGSGKDTAGLIIQYLTSGFHQEQTIVFNKNTDYTFNTSNWQIKKFADKLKDIVCLLLNCSREQLEDREFKEGELPENWWLYKHSETGKLITLLEFSLLREHQQTWYDLIKLTPRILLQLLGTECGRKIIHPNIWINSTLGNGVKFNNMEIYPNIIVTDVRFQNEADAILEKGGIVIRLNRESDLPISTHESETSLDAYNKFSYVIDNNGSIEELILNIKNILILEKII